MGARRVTGSADVCERNLIEGSFVDSSGRYGSIVVSVSSNARRGVVFEQNLGEAGYPNVIFAHL